MPKLDPPEYEIGGVFSKSTLAKERNVLLSAAQWLSTANHNNCYSSYVMPKPNHLPYPNSSEPIFKADCSPTAYGQSQMICLQASIVGTNVTHLHFTEISVAFHWVMAEPM